MQIQTEIWAQHTIRDTQQKTVKLQHIANKTQHVAQITQHTMN